MAITKQEALKVIDREKDYLCSVSDKIWDNPETAFEEYISSNALCEALEHEGFAVKKNVGDIETAFTGTWGSGKPVIGFLGEFDALSGLSQEAGKAVQSPIIPGGNGHGCGHNLLGVGALTAATATKEYLEKNKLPGTVIYFGCPGEEGGSGKTFMAREGVFKGLDFCITWHPGGANRVGLDGYSANYQLYYRFYGTAAHAGGSPQNGRSALDALDIMNIGVQFLREHVTPDVQMHYAVTNAGGYSPNVVQPYAEVLYLIRGKDLESVKSTYARVNKIAEGAAMMTETRVERDFVKGCSNLVSNEVIGRILHKNLEEVEKPRLTEADYQMAREIRDSIAPEARMDPSKRFDSIEDPVLREKMKAEHTDDVICEYVMPLGKAHFAVGSTDVADVSWNCPTEQCNTATMAIGTVGHSWQLVAQGKSNLAHEGMLYAARTMAGAAIDMINDPSLVEEAKAEFLRRTGGKPYECPIPKGIRPRSIAYKK